MRALLYRTALSKTNCKTDRIVFFFLLLCLHCTQSNLKVIVILSPLLQVANVLFSSRDFYCAATVHCKNIIFCIDKEQNTIWQDKQHDNKDIFSTSAVEKVGIFGKW